MKKGILYFCILFLCTPVTAQDGASVFNFLRFTTSARASALGGTNVSLAENDLSLVFQNPGLLGPEMSLNLNLNYLFYIHDIGMGSVIYTQALGERSAWGVGVNYANYGTFTETTPERTMLGEFSAKDICMNVFLARDLTDRTRGGITFKYIYSAFEQYTSMGLGVDVGLSFYDDDRELSMGLAGKNIGWGIRSYNDIREPMPWDIQLGLSKKLAHAPIRFSLTGMYLNQWKFYNRNGEKDNVVTTLAKHLVIGVDFVLSDNFWIGVGYNAKAGADMSLEQGNKLGGFSAGAGLRVRAFDIGCAVVRYHPSAASFLVSLTTSFESFKL